MNPMSDPQVNAVQLDLDRQRRCGFPEVVFGENKSAEALASIFDRLLASGVAVLATRVPLDRAAVLCERFTGAAYNPLARTFRIPLAQPEPPPGQSPLVNSPSPEPRTRVAVVTAGTSDLPVAEEARETLDWMGVDVVMIHDVGVAGPHRFPQHLDKLRHVAAVVVVAGMEGALPSVVGGHVDCPVIAVPTSVGYGANLGGIAALLSMLNSCAANVTVVNIDAGFKAGYVAGLIATRSVRVHP